MPRSDWTVDYVSLLDAAGDSVRVRIRIDRGRVVDFVVQYETVIDGEVFPVVRYDGSHGRGHRDLLDRNGDTLEGGKTWLPDHLTLADALEHGRQDLREHWPRYREAFLRRL